MAQKAVVRVEVAIAHAAKVGTAIVVDVELVVSRHFQRLRGDGQRTGKELLRLRPALE